MTYRKDDVEFHRLGYGYDSVPAVNVKVRGLVDDALIRRVAGDFGYDADLVLEWWHDVADRDDDGWAFQSACEQGWEYLQDIAREIWNDPRLRVYSEGRSGGWAYVDGIDSDDVAGWDAIALGRWSRFAKIARQVADGVPYGMVWLILDNVYESEHEATLPKLLA